MNHIEITSIKLPFERNGLFVLEFNLINSEVKTLERTYLNRFEVQSELGHYSVYDSTKIENGYYLPYHSIVHSLTYDLETSYLDFPNSIETMALIRKHESDLTELVANIKYLCNKMSLTPTIEFKKQTF